MAHSAQVKSRRRPRPHAIHKPNGVLHPRVQAVGPERFGILSVDGAKARSKIMLADFYGRVLIPPTVIEHNQAALERAVQLLREASDRHGLKDHIVAVERTGRYHGPIQRAFAGAGSEVRIVHPFATKQFRQAADPGNKTDDTDLSAIHRAAANGFGLLEHPPDPTFVRLQLLARRRRDLVRKRVAIQQQMHEHLQSFMPGYARCFDDVFDSEIALWAARHFGAAAAIVAAGLPGLAQQLRQAGLRAHAPTLEKILAWARQAPPPQEPASMHHRFFRELDADRMSKVRLIRAPEGELAEPLVLTPYVLLLGIPGISVVSAAELAGEMGPIRHYLKAGAIAGRAGLFPSRHQSDQVDRRHGALVRCANHDLRRAILMIADNLIKYNDHFRVLATGWRLKGKDPRDIHVKVASRFCRIAYQVVAGGTTYRHPCSQQRDYIIQKLIKFSIEHDIPCDRLLRNLDAAVARLPRAARREEAAPLAEELARVQKQRGAGPKLLGEILPAVLARLGVGTVNSSASGEPDPTERRSRRGPNNVVSDPKARSRCQSVTLCRITNVGYGCVGSLP
jgi:transposase